MSTAIDIVEPKKQAEQVQAAPAAVTEQAPQEAAKPMPAWVPGPVKHVVGAYNDKMKQWRNSTILAMPAPIVNNSSNVLAVCHVGTEMLMFKSGMKEGKLVENPGNPINWIKEPAQKIYADIATKSKSRDFSLKQLFAGNPIKNFKHYVMNTHEASLREAERQIAANHELMAAGKAAKALSLGNPWQTRTTGMGLAIWTLSTVIPERKESDDEIERMAKMRTLHPFQYVGERLKQAVWFPEWNKHKREMLGLGYLAIGTLSGLGAWRNRGDLVPELNITKATPVAEAKAALSKHVQSVRLAESEGKVLAKSVLENAKLIEKALASGSHITQGYKFNGGYFVTAIISFIAGLPLLFALDERKAYSTYGSVSLLRIPALPSSLYSKLKDRELGWQSYITGKLLFQVEDFMFSLIGGATKKVDANGKVTIVDHENLKREAIAEAKEEKAKYREEKHATSGARLIEQSMAPRPELPGTHITQATTPERAMPARMTEEAQLV